jgi:hypothetical protein
MALKLQVCVLLATNASLVQIFLDKTSYTLTILMHTCADWVITAIIH